MIQVIGGGSCIDLIITSRYSLHWFSQVFEGGTKYHQPKVFTMLKSTNIKLKTKLKKLLRNRSYKDFNKESFL